MIILTDTFNSRKISSHRTVAAAVKAQRKHSKAVKKANGVGSYVTYSIKSNTGEDISDEVTNEQIQLECSWR
jgi:hypothetical protein